MGTDVDTIINNYTIDELVAILGLDDVTVDNIDNKTEYFIKKFIKENNQKMATFFSDIKKRLTNYYDDLDKGEGAYIGREYDNEPVYQNKKVATQTKDWYKNQYLEQSDKNQVSKLTDRKQKIEVYDGNNHVPMNQEQLGVANTFNVAVAQDSLNPNLKNITERFIVLDSQYRQSGEVATDYTLDLSEQLKDVLSLRLYSFQIPVTWYIIDIFYGNTCFWVQSGDGIYSVVISIESGNYNVTNLVETLNTAVINAGFSNSSVVPSWTPIVYNQLNGKITIDLYGATYVDPSDPSKTFIVDDLTSLIFFDYTTQLQCEKTCASNGLYINQTLGWIMGYRVATELVKTSGNTGAAVLSLTGPKYLILVIDDYNQNHLNNGLVSITELSKTLKMPSYYSPDLPYICVDTNEQPIVIDKANINYGPYPQLVPSAPRTLTQSQLYTINQIIKNNDQNSNYRVRAPTTTDVFAIIPVKGGLKLGDLYVELSGSLQDLKRTYFGPVDIERLRIRLLDDKGNLLNLNGSDWSIILISENLYQY